MIEIQNIHLDKVSYDIIDKLKKLGYSNNEKMHYGVPGIDFKNSLRFLYDDQ